MRLIKAFFKALGMYTRFPVKFNDFEDTSPQFILMSLIPVGIIIGLMWWVLYKILAVFNIPLIALTAIVTVFPYWITGYLHIESYMDSSTQIISVRSGYNNNETRSSYGIIMLAVLMIFNFAGVYHFADIKDTPELLIFIPIISRELTVLMIFLLPVLTGGNFQTNKASKRGENTLILLLLLITTVVLCVTFTGLRGSILIGGMLISFIFSTFSVRGTVGISGDTAGYVLTVSETVGLFALAILNF